VVGVCIGENKITPPHDKLYLSLLNESAAQNTNDCVYVLEV